MAHPEKYERASQLLEERKQCGVRRRLRAHPFTALVGDPKGWRLAVAEATEVVWDLPGR